MFKINSKRQQGFTLIEVMIVVAILTIISLVSFGSYTSHTKKARRADAQTALLGLAQAMERHKTENGTYTSAITGSAPQPPDIFPSVSPVSGGSPAYDLTVEEVTASSYRLKATPRVGTGQADDGYLDLFSTGVRGWDRNNDGDANDANENCWQTSC